MPDPMQLPPLTGASLAALMPSPTITEFLARMQLPATIAPTTPEPLTFAQNLPFAQARAAEMMPVTTPPYAPPEPQQGGGGLGNILRAILQAVGPVASVISSKDPGAALQGLVQQQTALQEQRRREELARRTQIEGLKYQEQQRQKELGVQLAMQESGQQRQDRQDEERERRLDERDRREFMQRQEEILGQRTFQERQAEIERLYQDKKEQRIREENEKKLKLTEQSQRNQVTQSYIRAGVKNPKIRKELVDFDMGLITEDQLSPAAVKASEAAGKPVGGGGTGGSGTGRAVVELIDGQGNVLGRMPYSQVKFHDGEIQGFPGATLRFVQPQAQAGAQNIEQKIQALKGKVPNEQIIAAIRADAPQQADALIQKYGLQTAPKKDTPLFGWTDPKTGVTTPMFESKPFTAPGAKRRETGASIRGK